MNGPYQSVDTTEMHFWFSKGQINTKEIHALFAYS